MPSLILVMLLTMGLSHWLFEPLLGFLTPVFSLAWLGWALLAVSVWAFAGSDRR